jgi:pyridoxal phosphate enzyme (YggS family)
MVITEGHGAGNLDLEALAQVQDRIAAAQERGQHASADVTLVAVTKAFPVAALVTGYEAGLRTFGESRVQEAETKLPRFPQRPACEVRLIGHLQSNKAKKAVEIFDLIESIDSWKLLQRVDRLAGELKKETPVYLQVNAGYDEAKHGFDPEELLRMKSEMSAVEQVMISGVMTIAPMTTEEKQLRNCFRLAREIRDALEADIPSCRELSMGMTDDFELAVEEGATHVRIGRALFGDRPQL